MTQTPAPTTLPTFSLPIPGTYPHITKRKPKIGGLDNLGPGSTQHGESFLLKEGGWVGTSEFIGAAICHVCGVPMCNPSIVTIEEFGLIRHVFGSRMELGLKQFTRNDIGAWQGVIARCVNPSIFSAMLAIDLALGNDDRHWGNWLVQDLEDDMGQPVFAVRAMDFSRSWPVDRPAQHPLAHKSSHTWAAATNWKLFGIEYDQRVFFDTCVKIQGLTSHWLRTRVLDQLRGVFVSQADIDQLCTWWDTGWKAQVIEAIDSIENGGRP